VEIGIHLFQGGQVGAGNAAYGNLGLFLILGVRHQVSVFHHLNPALAVLDDVVMEALFDDLSGQGEIVQPLVVTVQSPLFEQAQSSTFPIKEELYVFRKQPREGVVPDCPGVVQ